MLYFNAESTLNTKVFNVRYSIDRINDKVI